MAHRPPSPGGLRDSELRHGHVTLLASAEKRPCRSRHNHGLGRPGALCGPPLLWTDQRRQGACGRGASPLCSVPRLIWPGRVSRIHPPATSRDSSGVDTSHPRASSPRFARARLAATSKSWLVRACGSLLAATASSCTRTGRSCCCFSCACLTDRLCGVRPTLTW